MKTTSGKNALYSQSRDSWWMWAEYDKAMLNISAYVLKQKPENVFWEAVFLRDGLQTHKAYWAKVLRDEVLLDVDTGMALAPVAWWDRATCKSRADRKKHIRGLQAIQFYCGFATQLFKGDEAVKEAKVKGECPARAFILAVTGCWRDELPSLHISMQALWDTEHGINALAGWVSVNRKRDMPSVDAALLTKYSTVQEGLAEELPSAVAPIVADMLAKVEAPTKHSFRAKCGYKALSEIRKDLGRTEVVLSESLPASARLFAPRNQMEVAEDREYFRSLIKAKTRGLEQKVWLSILDDLALNDTGGNARLAAKLGRTVEQVVAAKSRGLSNLKKPAQK